MRNDFAKLIVERPRFYSNGIGVKPRRRKRSSDLDNLPSNEGMRAPHILKWSGKEFNDYLSPIKRFIEGTVGRPWNKVYSEICENLRGDSTTQEHVLSHIDGYIAITVIRCELSESRTGLVSHNALGRNRGRRYAVNPGDLYVDPDDGIIKRAKILTPDVKKVSEKSFYNIDHNHVAIKKDGIWYMVEIRPYTVMHRRINRVDVYGKPFIDYRIVFVVDGKDYEYLPDVLGFSIKLHYYWGDTRPYGNRRVYGVSKKQMNSRELKRYNLQNN